MSKEKSNECKCPYCENEIKDKDSDECSFCKVKIIHCSSCGYPVSTHMESCPNCGNSL